MEALVTVPMVWVEVSQAEEQRRELSAVGSPYCRSRNFSGSSASEIWLELRFVTENWKPPECDRGYRVGTGKMGWGAVHGVHGHGLKVNQSVGKEVARAQAA